MVPSLSAGQVTPRSWAPTEEPQGLPWGKGRPVGQDSLLNLSSALPMCRGYRLLSKASFEVPSSCFETSDCV